MHKISELSKVNNDKEISKNVLEIKKFLNSDIVKSQIKHLLEKFTNKKISINIKHQGSYSRHTASFLSTEPSDVDLIMYIDDFYTNNYFQMIKSVNRYTKHMGNKIKTKLSHGTRQKNANNVPIHHFTNVKERVYQLLKEKFDGIYKVKNNNKSICIYNKIISVDIVIAQRWYLQLDNKKIKGSNVIINKYPYEVQNLPDQNLKNIELKSKKTKYLYEYIRAFKNINRLSSKKISSYHLECILYNIPNEMFDKRPNKNNMLDILNYIKEKFVTSDEYNDIYEINDVFIINKKISRHKLSQLISEFEYFIKTKCIN